MNSIIRTFLFLCFLSVSTVLILSSDGTLSGDPGDAVIGSIVGVVLGYIFIPSFRRVFSVRRTDDD